MDLEKRPLAILRAIAAFAKERRKWPDLDALRAFRRRLGCRTTVYRTLVRLRELQLVELRGGGHASRWVLTPYAWDVIAQPAFIPALERQRALQDADALLAAPSVPPLPSRPAAATPHALAAAARGLEVHS